MKKNINLIKLFVKSLRLNILSSQFGSVSQCYHYPTCGDYTWNKIEQLGLIKALFLGLKRSAGCIFIPGFKIHK